MAVISQRSIKQSFQMRVNGAVGSSGCCDYLERHCHLTQNLLRMLKGASGFAHPKYLGGVL